MRTIATALIVLASLVSSTTFSAEVNYQPPNISIIASNEPLRSVLHSISAAMDITVFMPPDLNTPVTCDIDNMPVERAFKRLLVDVNYALRWEQGGERLAGIVLLEEGSNSSLGVSGNSASGESLHAQSGRRVTTPHDRNVPQDQVIGVAGEQARMRTELAEHDAQMAQEMEQHKARMEQEMERERERIALEIEEERIRDENEVFIDYDD